MNLTESTKILVDVLKSQDSSEEQINESVAKYYNEIKKNQDEEEVGRSMKFLSELFSLDNLGNGSIASLICGSLIENGYPSRFIIDDYIDFFKTGMEDSFPFIAICEEDLQKQSGGDEEETEFDLIQRKKEELITQLGKSIKSLEGLDSYYQCGISIFSSGREEFERGKSSLSEVSKYSIYNSAFYWLSKLFEVLYNEPIIAIDLNTKKGVKGRISGIVDNFQLQVLLMGVPELNEKVNVHKRHLDVMKGLDVQQLDESIPGKWNMCNWEYLTNQKNNPSSCSDSENWIWGEGIPDDISKFNNYRVILLEKPSYSRGLPIQRTFKNLKAGIRVDEELTENQVEVIVNEMKNKN